MALSEKKRSIIVIAVIAVLLISGAYVLIYFLDDEYKGDPYTQEDINNAWERTVTVETVMEFTEKLPEGSIATPDVMELEFFGTGSVIDHGGNKVLTNAHVIAVFDGQVINIDGTDYNTDNYNVVRMSITCNFFYNSSESHAQAYKAGGYAMNLIDHDFSVDLALLGFVGEVPDVTPLTLGDSSSLLKNQPVFTIGNSLGGGLRLSEGKVTSRSVGVMWISDYMINAVMADLQIYHGNSGGPMITVGGVIVGVVSAGDSTSEDAPSPTAYAVPSNKVKEFLSSIPIDAGEPAITSVYAYEDSSCAASAC